MKNPKIKDKVDAWTEKTETAYHNTKFAQNVGVVSETIQDGFNVATNTVVLALSKAWLGIGVWRPANTDPNGKWSDQFGNPAILRKRRTAEKIESTPTEEYAARQGARLADTGAHEEALQKLNGGSTIESRPVEEYVRTNSYDKLWSMRLGGDAETDKDSYYLPLSQTFTLRAKKKLNISSLVDGIDIIQQTRKEAKTIDCSLRISLRESQTNLQIVDMDNEVQTLSQFLADLYEADAVFYIANDMINNTFGVEYVIMSDYKFIPRVSMGTYTFEFALTEVKYGENVLTLDLSEVDAGTQRQIVD